MFRGEKKGRIVGGEKTSRERVNEECAREAVVPASKINKSTQSGGPSMMRALSRIGNCSKARTGEEGLKRKVQAR